MFAIELLEYSISWEKKSLKYNYSSILLCEKNNFLRIILAAVKKLIKYNLSESNQM